MFLSKIHITLRKSILDPQGKAVEHAIASLGIEGIRNIRMGKYIELQCNGDSEQDARHKTEEICRKLLANPVMEDFHFEVEKI